jgi:hypothetical protein
MSFRQPRQVEAAPREHRMPPWKIAIAILSLVVMSPIIGLVATFVLVTFAPVIPLMAILLVGFLSRGPQRHDAPRGTPEPSHAHMPSLENPHAFGQLG